MTMTEYMRHYAMPRYQMRKKQLYDALGGVCVMCGTNINLEFDHIDRSTKGFSITSALWWMAMPRLLIEVKKCQLLCSNCHILKSIAERGRVEAAGTHGTLSSYRYCKCALCKEAKAKYMREYKSKHSKRKHAEVPKRQRE